MDSVKFFLVLEKRPGDYNVIEINNLDISKSFVANDLVAIDFFTCNYTEKEIRDSILRSNITHKDYLGGNLKIVSDVKHNLCVLTKDVYGIIRDFQNNNEYISNHLKNKMFGLYKKSIEQSIVDKSIAIKLIDNFKEALNSGNKREIFKIVEGLPYLKARMIYLCIYDKYNK